ncbi:MAG TPA: hypothetical protein VGR62_18980, partial [Candidatus Binatia bacterium]|nr:hypothetical protein [Candidatus Binatia bacterium]
MRLLTSVAFLLVVTAVAPARGADTGIQGGKIILRSGTLSFVSKDPLTPFPPLGSADDPSTGGATIDLIVPTASGAIVVPAGVGKPGWKTRTGAHGAYAYRNGGAPGGSSPVRSLSLRQGRVLKLTARAVPILLTAPLGSVGIRLTMGATRACALFGAPTIVKDTPGSFTARNAPAPADCSDATLGRLPVCGNGVIEAGETCEAADDAACPGHCAADCTCEAYCGDGTHDPGEQCDGTDFPPGFVFGGACANTEGAVPACQDNCTCCAIGLCHAGTFNVQCCPGFRCPLPLGPNDLTFCQR